MGLKNILIFNEIKWFMPDFDTIKQTDDVNLLHNCY